MTIKIKRLVASLLALSLAPIAMATTTIHAEGDFQGHHYRVVIDAGSNYATAKDAWDAANAAAIASDFEGTPGHLATITSFGEDEFIESLRSGLSPKEAWVGGRQVATVNVCDPLVDKGCGWTWVNGEGSISTFQFPLPLLYENWLDQEPNNQGSEQYLGVGLGGQFGWNDEQALGNIGGYVIEYDVPIPATECTFGGDGCPLSEASTLTFPPSVELTGVAQIDVRRFEFTDDLSLCGTATRTIFGPLTDPDDNLPDAIIPAYLCGSPKFQVIIAETTGINIPDGTILVENQTSDVFLNNLYDCTGPNFPDAGDPLLHPDDPQNRDVMAWQTTDLTKMPENDLGMMHSFPGSVGEFTFECGSSRGKGNSLSLYFVGLHIDFGPGFDIATNPGGNHTQFALLTRYKLHVLKDVILESKVALNSNFGQRIGYRTLRWFINSAIYWHDRGAYNRALRRLRLIDWVLQYLPYTEITDENYQGETEMRTSNGIFMYTDKVIQ